MATQPGVKQIRSQGRLPNFLIIGAPKAGTTTLFDYLADHPQAYGPPLKELYFFSVGWEKGVEWYRRQFRKAGRALAVGEATPTYLYREDALLRMRELVPDVKLVAILREPVDRAYSDYWYMVQLGEKRSFEEAIRQEMAGESLERRVGYLEAGRYVHHLRRVAELFPRENLLVLLMDDLRSDPDATYSALCEHLGIDPTFRTRKTTRARNPAYELRWPALRHLAWRLRLGRRAPWLFRRLEAINRKPISYPKMDPAMRAKLKAFYAEDNAALAAWLGRDLSAWS